MIIKQIVEQVNGIILDSIENIADLESLTMRLRKRMQLRLEPRTKAWLKQSSRKIKS